MLTMTLRIRWVRRLCATGFGLVRRHVDVVAMLTAALTKCLAPSELIRS
jgi:hypothetical protein